MRDPILNKYREMNSDYVSGPCIVVVPATKKPESKKDMIADLISSMKNGKKDKFIEENSLTNAQVKGIQRSMYGTFGGRQAKKGQVRNKKGLHEGQNLQEYLKYVLELYFEGKSADYAIAKAMYAVYGRV